jgi:hypothetical protein
MDELHRGSERALLSRIERKELIPKEELIEKLGSNLRWVRDALRAGRLFCVLSPSGIEYFPAFFAEDRYDRRALGKVAQALVGLPGPSKYYFFETKSTRLKMTPLEALALGRVMEAVACAVGFAER